ncbi:MAG TPA: hypothetical protein VF989_12225 [Polyangiaceae bacterium]
MPRAANVVASDEAARAAAGAYLAANGSALSAAICGFFAVAGGDSGVLLSPMSILVAGVGIGARAFDGRLRQPGLGARRPRGLKDSDVVPEVASVATATSVSAALVALGYDGCPRLKAVIDPGISAATAQGASARAGLLRRIQEVGAAALQEPGFVQAVLRAAGPAQGGLMTPADLGARGSLDFPAVERQTRSGQGVEPPWARDTGAEARGTGGAICVIDGRGQCAALSYRRMQGFRIEELGLDLPLGAVPVRRGVRRIRPGTPLPAPAPIAVAWSAEGTPIVLADPDALLLDDDIGAPLRVIGRERRFAL